MQQHHQNNLQKSLSRTDSHYRELTTNQQFNERQFSMSSPIETPSNKFWSSSFSHVHSLSPSLSCPIPLEIREWNKSTTHYNDKNKSSLIHSLQSEINRLSEENLVRHISICYIIINILKNLRKKLCSYEGAAVNKEDITLIALSPLDKSGSLC